MRYSNARLARHCLHRHSNLTQPYMALLERVLGQRTICPWHAMGGEAMSEPRVKVGLWVSMALRLADREGRLSIVLRRGDPDAGGVLLVLRGRTGVCVLSQVRAANGEAAWMHATGAEAVDEGVADAYVTRQVEIDPDLWVLEFEAPDLLPPFGARIL